MIIMNDKNLDGSEAIKAFLGSTDQPDFKVLKCLLFRQPSLLSSHCDFLMNYDSIGSNNTDIVLNHGILKSHLSDCDFSRII